MFKQVRRFLARGFIGSLTGGLYYDTQRSNFINTVLMYLWFFFFLFPLTLTMALGRRSLLVEILYPVAILLVFIAIKVPNHYLHHFFDTVKAADDAAEDKPEEANLIPATDANNRDNSNSSSNNNNDSVGTDNATHVSASNNGSINTISVCSSSSNNNNGSGAHNDDNSVGVSNRGSTASSSRNSRHSRRHRSGSSRRHDAAPSSAPSQQEAISTTPTTPLSPGSEAGTTALLGDSGAGSAIGAGAGDANGGNNNNNNNDDDDGRDSIKNAILNSILNRQKDSEQAMTIEDKLPYFPFSLVVSSTTSSRAEGLSLPTGWHVPSDKKNSVSLSSDGRTATCISNDASEVIMLPANCMIQSSVNVFYFEVTILDQGSQGQIGIGMSPPSLKFEGMPGWSNGSYGYHGDDGCKFCYRKLGHGEPYGPTYGTGDVIGCGWDKGKRIIFFTKNGENLGIAYDHVIGRFLPVIGLNSPGAKVSVNFGQEPFRYNIEEAFKYLSKIRGKRSIAAASTSSRRPEGSMVEERSAAAASASSSSSDIQDDSIPQLDGSREGRNPTVFSYIDENGEMQHYVMYEEGGGDDAAASSSSSSSPNSEARLNDGNINLIIPASESVESPNHGIGPYLDPEILSSEMSRANRIADYGALNMAGREDQILDFYRKQLRASNNPTFSQKYYQMKIFGRKISVPFDRLTLESMFDRNGSWFEVIICILLATLTAWIGYRLMGLYQELSIVFMWFAMACAHFSLVKSVQPDAHSSQHHNMWTAYSRAFYFVVFGGLALLIDLVLTHAPLDHDAKALPPIILFGGRISQEWLLVTLRDFFLYLILFSPILFLFGWLPQCTTFIMLVAEQVHMHAFGGSGSVSLAGAILELAKDIAALAVLVGVGYYSVTQGTFGRDYYSGLYSSFLVALSYLLSRSPSNPRFLWAALSGMCCGCKPMFSTKNKSAAAIQQENERKETIAFEQNLQGVNPQKRLLIDVGIALLLFVVVAIVQVFDGLHRINPYFFYILASVLILVGFISHYLLPQLRKPQPWLVFRKPILKRDDDRWGGGAPSKLKGDWYEYVSIVLREAEKYAYIPLVISTLTDAFDLVNAKYNPVVGLIVMSIAAIKAVRGPLTDASRMWITLLFTLLLFSVDFHLRRETFIIEFFVVSIAVRKLEEICLKIAYMSVYSAPWSMSWGSPFHALLHPVGLPHTALAIFQIIWSAVVSSPIYPVIGSPLFAMSYGRPTKFWEKSYTTKRMDSTTQKLSATLGMEGLAGSEYDPNNLNSIFYEHLVVALRRALPGAIRKGVLGSITTGDMLMIMNDKLSAIVHIIEIGNGFATFQLRGIEFKGTYCQERELEAITEASEGDVGGRFCQSCHDRIVDRCPRCAPIADLFQFLSPATMAEMRWRTWQVINTNLVLRTYNVISNNASTLLNLYEQRRELITLYVRAIIFYTLQRDEVEAWTAADSVFAEAIAKVCEGHVDCDPVFSERIDADYDELVDGISFRCFLALHRDWIARCIAGRKQKRNVEYSEDAVSSIQKLCYLLSLVGRRSLGLADGTPATLNADLFLERFHALFKNDYRITSLKDEWIFGDLNLLPVLNAGLRMSLRLYQDSFTSPDEYSDPNALYDAIEENQKDMVVCHEGDPQWRESILKEVPQLFTLRRTAEEGGHSPKHHVIMLELRPISFRVIKLNRESVRGLWAGQQHELVFLQNQNSERGSIQQMKTVLRNIINQSCDLPVGYPVFVSPLTTAY